MKFHLVVAVSSLLIGSLSFAAGDKAEGEKLFKSKTCFTCHSVTDQKQAGQVGPALKGVTKRVPKGDWLKKWIKDPIAVLKSGDAYAAKVKKENMNIDMPTLPVTDAEVDHLIAYLESLDGAAAAPAAGGAKPADAKKKSKE